MGWRKSRPKGSRHHMAGRESLLLVGGWGSGMGYKEHGPQNLQHPKLPPRELHLNLAQGQA